MTPMLRREANELFGRTLTRTIVVPVALLALLALIFFWLINNLLAAADLVDHTDEVIAEVNGVQASILNQAAGMRGYLLTGNSGFLEPESQVTELDSKLDTLGALVGDNPTQTTRVQQLRDENAGFQDFVERAIAERENAGDYVALASTGEGELHLDRIRRLVVELIGAEQQLRSERVQTAGTMTRVVLTASILGTLLVGVVLAFAARRALTNLSRTYNHALRSAESNEQTLYTEREWFRGTLASIGDAVIATDARGNIAFMNPVAETLTGWTSDEARGKPLNTVFTIINDQTQAPAEIPVERVLREGIVAGLANHTALIRRDGTRIPIDDSAAPVRDANGVLTGAVLVFRDISERYQAEGELRESEQRYRALAEAMPMIVWTATPTGEIDYYNTRLLEYVGMSSDEALRAGGDQLIHPDDMPHLVEKWQQAIASREPLELEYRIRRHNGAYRWFLTRATPIRDEHGAIVQWIGTSADIDDQKQIVEELRESASQFRHLADSMPQLVWITQPDGYHEYFNQRWYEYTGTTLEQTRGEGWSHLLHPDDLARTLEVWSHSLATGEPYDIEYRFKQAATGEYRWFIGRAVPVRDEDGQITQWFGTCTDIDDQKRSEETLRERTGALAQATAALEERNRELDQFAYVTSHDLKAPLRGIANLSQWIEEDLGPNATEDIRRQLELLRGRVHRMEGLIDGILQFSRIGRVRGSVEHVDLNVLLADVVDLLDPPEGVTVEVQPGMPTLYTDRVHVQQVFQNLISNALKHGQRPDLHVEVRCQEAGRFYEFAVADNGAGIAPQYHDRVFVIFQTLAARDKVEGTGLGLSLVRKIVELHGGRVWLESEEGAGATFRFTWPKQA